jgi:flagellar motor switch protein FliG
MSPKKRRDDDLPIAALLAPDILALLDEAPEAVSAETEEMHPADLADVAEAIPRDRVVALLNALGAERAADVLEYLDEDLRSDVLETMTTSPTRSSRRCRRNSSARRNSCWRTRKTPPAA